MNVKNMMKTILTKKKKSEIMCYGRRIYKIGE